MSLWIWKNQDPGPNLKGSDDSERTRVSVFDRIEKGLKRLIEDAWDLSRKKQLWIRIQKEEEAKTELGIEKRIKEEEKKLQQKSEPVRIPTSDSEPEKESKQEQFARAFKDLKKKVEGDYTLICEEVHKLLRANIICEIKYQIAWQMWFSLKNLKRHGECA